MIIPAWANATHGWGPLQLDKCMRFTRCATTHGTAACSSQPAQAQVRREHGTFHRAGAPRYTPSPIPKGGDRRTVAYARGVQARRFGGSNSATGTVRASPCNLTRDLRIVRQAGQA